MKEGYYICSNADKCKYPYDCNHKEFHLHNSCCNERCTKESDGGDSCVPVISPLNPLKFLDDDDFKI